MGLLAFIKHGYKIDKNREIYSISIEDGITIKTPIRCENCGSNRFKKQILKDLIKCDYCNWLNLFDDSISIANDIGIEKDNTPFFLPDCPKCESNEYVYESEDPDTSEIFYVCLIHRETLEVNK